MRTIVVTSAITLIPLAGCWTVEPWLPQHFPHDRGFTRLNPTIPNNAAHLRWYELSLAREHLEVLDQLWRETDEQIVASEIRPLLRANGLRAGVLAGRVPIQLTEAISRAPSPPQLLTLFLPPGQSQFQPLGTRNPYLTCPISYAGESSVVEFSEAQPGLTLEWHTNSNGSREFTITPAIRHRPAMPVKFLWNQENCWPLATGESETLLAFLKMTVPLKPQDTLVLGAHLEKESSLGTCLFSDAERGCIRVILVRYAGGTDKGCTPNDYKSLFPNPSHLETPDDSFAAN
ncbi:MAG: hypothetical protein RMJ82_11520 [Gemmatales bacterium]|nr:hypothetical protein [Gemmatales bacterium]